MAARLLYIITTLIQIHLFPSSPNQVRMDDVASYIAKSAPFLTTYWHYVLGGLITAVLAFILSYLLSLRGDHTKNNGKSPKIVSYERGEHPLSEFSDEKPDPSLAPPLHDADTPHIAYAIPRFEEGQLKRKAREFYEHLNKRRSVRHFSSDPVPLEVIQDIVRAAGTSPSGAHSEPWTFVVVQEPKLKCQIREIIEQEEYLNYDRRMGDRWVNDLKFVRTTHEKPYLENAPYVIVVFKQQYHLGEDGVRYAHYYYEISTAIACGILVTAIHNAGLVTVTTTPLNAGGSLRELLGRPENEKVMLLLPVGYPASDATVPDVQRKPLDDIMVLK